MNELPLHGIRITDFCHVWAGPHVTQWLAVMGAEVIKVESKLHPDLTRSSFAGGKRLMPGLNSSVDFSVLNYGKKSCTINMTAPKGRELAKKLIMTSDVVTENFGGAIMDRWGLSYSELKKIKHDIIMYSGSGFGRTGPYSELPAYAPIVDAFAGFLSLNGFEDGAPYPFGVGGWTDLTAAQHGALAIMAALHHRQKSGEGQYIDLSMTEVAISFIPCAIMDYVMNGRIHGPQGNRDIAMAPHGCYRCQGNDAWIAIAISSEDEWKSLCRVIGKQDLLEDSRFADELSRWKNQQELGKLIQEWTKERSPHDIMRILQEAGIMATPSCKHEEVVGDANLAERDFFIDIDHPEMGCVRFARLPLRISGVPEGNYEHAPTLGEHNDYVFEELLSLSRQEIAELEGEEVIF